MFNFTNHRHPNSRHNFDFLNLPLAAPEKLTSRKNWWVNESTFRKGLRYTEAPLQSIILKENEPKLKKRACSINE
jgi:hypothetical protein